MAGRGYKVASFLICDEIRREDNGKEILIGVYSKSIVVRELPAKLNSLVFRTIVEFQHSNFSKYFAKLRSPDRKNIFETEGDVKIASIDDPVHFSLAFAAPIFAQAGKYTFALGFDSPPRKIGEFEVRIARTEAERARVGLDSN